MDLTTISGTIYDVNGVPVSGVGVFLSKVIASGLLIEHYQRQVALSDENGEIEFTVPRNSTAWISGNFYAGGTFFNVNDGVAVTIPDAATETLENLGTLVAIDTGISGLANALGFLRNDGLGGFSYSNTVDGGTY